MQTSSFGRSSIAQTHSGESVQPVEIRKPPRLPEIRIADEPLPLERIYEWERTRGSKIFLTQPVKGIARHWNWAAAMAEARRIAAYLQSQNWPPGSRVVILSKNCAWWLMADFAIWMAGHVTVPIYTSLTNEAARCLMEHCDPVLAFVGPVENAGLIDNAVLATVQRIRFPNAPPCHAIDWDAIVRETEPLMGNPTRAASDLATIIYTSGTTGAPKGAMHSFQAFPYFAKAVTQVVGKGTRHRCLSYLPLAHIAERALTETAAIYQGWHIFFCEGVATFMQDLKRARPTVFFSVPRLYAKFQQGILAKISPRKLNVMLRIPLVGYFIRRRILHELGLGRVRFAASGSAALPLDLLLWFRRLGLRLAEGYGTTETGITHTAPRGRSRPGFVGRNSPGVETIIASNREVLVKSPMNMLGYYRDDAATREIFSADGFVHTGDLGEADAKGWLKLTGRIKERFKTSKGEYVSPVAIEAILGAHDAVEASLVMGAGLAAPFAVIVLSAQALQTAADSVKRQALEDSLRHLLANTNAKLAPHERLRFLVLVDSTWSIENGFLTPTLKLKRSALEAHYFSSIPEWTSEDAKLIWRIHS